MGGGGCGGGEVAIRGEEEDGESGTDVTGGATRRAGGEPSSSISVSSSNVCPSLLFCVDLAPTVDDKSGPSALMNGENPENTGDTCTHTQTHTHGQKTCRWWRSEIRGPTMQDELNEQNRTKPNSVDISG